MIQPQSNVKYKIKTTIQSRTLEFAAELDFLVIPSITNTLPEATIDKKDWKIPDEFKLADPQFNIKGKIDMLIGAVIFLQILWQKKYEISPLHPLLQNTAVGWIISGQLNNEVNNPVRSHCQVNIMGDLDVKLQRFWELEKYDYQYDNMTQDERDCERDYVKNTKRDSGGRYIVIHTIQLKFQQTRRLEVYGNEKTGASATMSN